MRTAILLISGLILSLFGGTAIGVLIARSIPRASLRWRKFANRFLYRWTVVLSQQHGTYCGRCRKPAQATATRHGDVPGRLGRNLPGKGCGARWLFITKDYYLVDADGFDQSVEDIRMYIDLRDNEFGTGHLFRIDMPFGSAPTIAMRHPGR